MVASRSPARAIVLALLPLAAAWAGCVAPANLVQNRVLPSAGAVSFDGLNATSAAQTMVNPDGTKTFVFKGSSVASFDGILQQVHPQDPSLLQKFDVDGRVGFVEVNLTYDATSGRNVYAWIVDPWNRIQCGTGPVTPHDCTAPVPRNTTAKAQWSIEVITGSGGNAGPVSTPGLPYEAAVTLHPASQITVGDPMAGVDPAISFNEAFTGARGSEPNIGVLRDGAIFAQEGLATLKSTDDGKTWTNVAGATTSKRSFDPMLYADPYTNAVYVDQLTIACSILAWTKDEGASWTSNPAACGLPGDDHEKLAVGPSPVPSSPFPAVYYAFSSFAQGVYVSHSYDGGVTFVAAPVVGVGDGRSYDNTGPIFADRSGEVYDPLYMCDHGGYVGVGVSHDFGATFHFVQVSDQKGPCADPDPGLSVDTAGNVYISYWRPDGVFYAVSKDHGETWSSPVKVSLPGQKSFVHVDSIAGDAGRLAIAYRATSDSAKGPDNADGWAAWFLYVAFVENATSSAPAMRVGMMNADMIPDQRGQICTSGIACAGGSRNLLDFIDIAVGPDGRVYVADSAGCKVTCPTPADSRVSLAPVGIETAGPRLFAAKAPWAGGATVDGIPGIAATPAAALSGTAHD